ncbi:hypothetical protein scyTo_0003191 [Scyliorhinus torazame]|uniref:Uncharacterized protein n=1 Tax=Scyliorhinus torazame TaxID=75743 RepID=A0A401PLT3_SCYTO|nr:hypothetical protein [Scyliorhinus torazame]
MVILANLPTKQEQEQSQFSVKMGGVSTEEAVLQRKYIGKKTVDLRSTMAPVVHRGQEHWQAVSTGCFELCGIGGTLAVYQLVVYEEDYE